MENDNHKEVSLRDLNNQLKARLIDRRGNEGEYSYLELLYNILDKIGDISSNENNAAIKEKVEELADAVEKINTRIDELSNDVSTVRDGDIIELKEDLSHVSTELTDTMKQTELEIVDVKLNLRSELNQLKQKVSEDFESIGTTYVRWGRTDCPGNGSVTIYSGFAGGSRYDHEGAAASMLCLPYDPDWKSHDDSEQDTAFIYGAEYNDFIRPNTNPNVNKLFEDDVPCVVCTVKRRSSKIMIPGKSTCSPGWTMEYWGYLMAGRYSHKAASDYYCVDSDPEAIPGTKADQNGYTLYFVEGRCGSLKCPPYVNNRELTCVVCTK